MYYRVQLQRNQSSVIPILKFELSQKLRTYGARNIKFFTVGKDTFLGVVNGFLPRSHIPSQQQMHNAVLYKWDGIRFVPFQNFPVDNPLEWSAVKGPSNQVLLALRTNGPGKKLHTFQFYGGKWQITVDLYASTDSTGPILPVISGDISFLLSPNADNSISVFNVSFSDSNDLIEKQEQNLKLCQKIKDDLIQTEDPTLNDLSNNLIDSNGQNTFSGKKTFTIVIVNGIVNFTESSSRVNSIVIHDFIGFSRPLSSLQHSITVLGEQLDNPNLMSRSTNQTLTGDLYVTKLTADQMITSSAEIDILLGYNFIELQSKAVFKSQIRNNSLIANGHLEFENLYLRNGLTVHPNRINFLSVREDFVNRRKGPNIIRAKKEFMSGISIENSFSMRGNINGMSLNNMVHKSSNRVIVITDSCRFGDITINGNMTQIDKGFVNGLLWQELTSKAVKNGSNIEITGRKSFQDLEIIGSLSSDDFIEINGKDLEYYNKNIVRVQGDYVLHEKVRMYGPTFMDLDVTSAEVNGIDLYRDVISLSDSQWYLEVAFVKLEAYNLSVNIINGISTADLVTKQGEQVITGKF